VFGVINAAYGQCRVKAGPGLANGWHSLNTNEGGLVTSPYFFLTFSLGMVRLV